MEKKPDNIILKVVYAVEFERALVKHRKDKILFGRIEKQLDRIIYEPNIGKPWRYLLKNF